MRTTGRLGQKFTARYSSLAGIAALLTVLCGLAYPPGILAQGRGQRTAPTRPTDFGNFSILSQDWRRFPGLAVADITFNNGNDYAIRNTVITCDFLDKD